MRKLRPLRAQDIGVCDAAYFPQLHSTGVVVSGDDVRMPAFMMSRMRGAPLSGCVDELSGTIGGVPTAQTLLELLRCALRPLEVLERLRIVHGDMNLGNVFVEMAKGPDGREAPSWVGLVDLGAARGEGLLTTRTGVPGVRGAAAFTAPEVFDSESPYHEEYRKNPLANVWALAALVYYLRTKRPYIAHTRLRLGEARGDDPAARALLAEALIASLNVDPRRRVGAHELLRRIEAGPEAAAPCPAGGATRQAEVPVGSDARGVAALYSDGTLVLGRETAAARREGASLVRAWDLPLPGSDSPRAPWAAHARGVRRVICEGGVSPTSTRRWFAGMDGCVSMDLAHLDFSRVRDASDMFLGCSVLGDIRGMDTWDTSRLERADGMFGGCLSLRNISSDLERWDVGSLRSSVGMFTGANVSLAKPRFWEVKYGRPFV